MSVFLMAIKYCMDGPIAIAWMQVVQHFWQNQQCVILSKNFICIGYQYYRLDFIIINESFGVYVI